MTSKSFLSFLYPQRRHKIISQKRPRSFDCLFNGGNAKQSGQLSKFIQHTNSFLTDSQRLSTSTETTVGRLKQRLDGQRTMTYMITHDMRFPITSIIETARKALELVDKIRAKLEAVGVSVGEQAHKQAIINVKMPLKVTSTLISTHVNPISARARFEQSKKQEIDD